MRFGLVRGSFLAILLACCEAVSAQSEMHAVPAGTPIASDEGWSLDDIKDVCEALQFIVISIGIGTAVSWFWFWHLPAKHLPRIEFDVEIDRAGENGSAWIVDVVVSVKNLGGVTAELTDVRYSIESRTAPRVRISYIPDGTSAVRPLSCGLSPCD